jgi:hypothetical protein
MVQRWPNHAKKGKIKPRPKFFYIMTIVALRCIGIVITPCLKLKTWDCI